MSFHDMNALGICIDEYSLGEMHGRIYSPFREEPIAFNSAITLIKNINDIFDDGDYPQSTMRVRGFNRNSKDTKSALRDEKAAVGDPSKVTNIRSNIRGKKATFGVKVMFRQNASWQGTVNWIEKNREESFRSVLELLMLMDSTFEAEQSAAAGSDNERLTANM